MDTEHEIIFENGTIRAVYNDTILPVMANFDFEIKRASHVEPGNPMQGQNPQKWYADLSPVQGPLLGPFDSRQTALDAEVAKLKAMGF